MMVVPRHAVLGTGGILLTWYATALIFLGGGVVVLVKAIVVNGFLLRWVAAAVLLVLGLQVLIRTIIRHNAVCPLAELPLGPHPPDRRRTSRGRSGSRVALAPSPATRAPRS
jgi:hypothetical protein